MFQSLKHFKTPFDRRKVCLPPARIWIQMETHRRVEAAHSNHCNSPNSQLLCKRSDLLGFFKISFPIERTEQPCVAIYAMGALK